jgi:glutamate--cysteine ligase
VVEDLTVDLAAVLDRLAPLGITLSDRALDCARPGVRQLDSPRYAAMAEYFAADDPEVGQAMMCCCVGLQVNLDAGETPAEVARRWRLLHDLGPSLIAAFANSPIPGWRSRRQGIWQELDPARTAPPPGEDPVLAWARYALEAPVMMVRGEQWVARPGFTFRDWVSGRTALGRPTVEDLDYHLTTLFPPVRPRGWFEVRYLDGQPRPWWPVPVLVMWELMRDEAAADAALDPRATTPDAWDRAARLGLTDPALADSARRLLELTLDGIDGLGHDLVARFADHYTFRGLAPADEP